MLCVRVGASATRRPDGHYQTYERLGKSYTAVLRYENLPLRHGTRYYVNADVENVLGYRATLTSQGTMVDMTPPEPGPVGQVVSDNLTADGCNASIIQRCEEHVTNSLNHRSVRYRGRDDLVVIYRQVHINGCNYYFDEFPVTFMVTVYSR